MSFCPNCSTEYTGAATKCNDCGADLVESLPQGWSITRDPENLKPAELGHLLRFHLKGGTRERFRRPFRAGA